ncbi:NADH-quinone oxidoreductase [Stereum hirsutum FP-91666 SS1]|uniref:NADH-quinone oxidoreductase n=1 Tax=Stereum hirsutum (strain FP-91666) TaxID=721885 RepID=UPI000440E8FF|nr:NADH-quinone oxidoreductase [Stereum hirsutum FP-91666 SS1]EIM87144.1 NADH-quinone oxidoreductase [Stereum hirsutum FP-91666 SS1]
MSFPFLWCFCSWVAGNGLKSIETVVHRYFSIFKSTAKSNRGCWGVYRGATRGDEPVTQLQRRHTELFSGSALIQACEAAGATIPRFCYHDRLAIAGNCRMCLVEVERSPKPVASCAMPAMPGSKVFTNSPLVHEAREGVMEFLLSNHPLDCPICDQGGECDLQDQSMRYGSDRSRFHEITGKRAVEDKDLGPLVKTSMNRCIQCTRCIRFANEVAGVEELGSTGRGNDMQIGMYVEKTMDSELSGNIVDLCPVGALTSKPYAFHSRPWELKNTESVDVMDAVGSNIRIDSRGVQVMRVQPRTNDDVNEEWISDKTRFAYDGLKFQRLTVPLIKRGDRFVSASWEDALVAIKEGLEASGAKGDEIQAVAGHLADTETLVALKDFVNRLGSDNTALDQTGGYAPPVAGIDVRSNYLFNTTIPGVEEADAILLVGTNPRHEAAVLNSRIRKSWLHTGLEVGLVGERADTTYGYDYLGADAKGLADFVAGKGEFAKKFQAAKKPLIIVGSAVSEHADGPAVYNALAKFVEKNKDRLVTPEWNGFSVLQRVASRAAAYDIGFVPTKKAASANPKFIFLCNADEIDPKSIPKDAFVVYQGHHGDIGAQLADVCLPAAAYTEKSVTWVNTEGRAQLGRAAVPPPGASREDWKIIRALSEVVGQPLPYDDVLSLRDRMWEISPTLVRYDSLEPTSTEFALEGLKTLERHTKGAKVTGAPFQKPISNFYQTDPISRASVTMAHCTKSFVKAETYGFSQDEKAPQASYA